MTKKRYISYGYIHDLLHHDYGYTTDEIDEIVEKQTKHLYLFVR